MHLPQSRQNNCSSATRILGGATRVLQQGCPGVLCRMSGKESPAASTSAHSATGKKIPTASTKVTNQQAPTA